MEAICFCKHGKKGRTFYKFGNSSFLKQSKQKQSFKELDLNDLIASMPQRASTRQLDFVRGYLLYFNYWKWRIKKDWLSLSLRHWLNDKSPVRLNDWQILVTVIRTIGQWLFLSHLSQHKRPAVAGGGTLTTGTCHRGASLFTSNKEEVDLSWTLGWFCFIIVRNIWESVFFCLEIRSECGHQNLIITKPFSVSISKEA